MPTYEYACKSCGKRTEVVQSFSDPPLTECPTCGGPLRKVFGTPGIVLKGSGFYKTDSRSVANGKGQPKEKEAASAGADGGAEGTATKEAKGSAEPTSNGSSGSSGGSQGSGGGDAPPSGKPAATPAAAG